LPSHSDSGRWCLSDADLGHEFKIVGDRWDGEQGHSIDACHWQGDEFVDEFAAMFKGHVRTDLGPVATYTPEAIWLRQRDHTL
jgi:hypothetical protein